MSVQEPSPQYKEAIWIVLVRSQTRSAVACFSYCATEMMTRIFSSMSITSRSWLSTSSCVFDCCFRYSSSYSKRFLACCKDLQGPFDEKLPVVDSVFSQTSAQNYIEVRYYPHGIFDPWAWWSRGLARWESPPPPSSGNSGRHSGQGTIVQVFHTVLGSRWEIFENGDRGSTQNFDTNLMSIVVWPTEPFSKKCLFWL